VQQRLAFQFYFCAGLVNIISVTISPSGVTPSQRTVGEENMPSLLFITTLNFSFFTSSKILSFSIEPFT